MEHIIILIIALVVGIGAHFLHTKGQASHPGKETMCDKIEEEIEHVAESILAKDGLPIKFDETKDNKE